VRLYDTHVNFHAAQFAEAGLDADGLIDAARASGVRGFLAICDRWDHRDRPLVAAHGRHGVRATVGVHPHHAKDHLGLTKDDLVRHAEANETIAAIGECGLDLHYGYSALDQQLSVFRTHIEAARITGLPLVIHSRNADQVMIDVLQEAWSRGAFRFLLHCYTSGPELARFGLDHGGMISFSGIVTFKAAEAVRAIALQTPADRILVETDCPYLSPVPLRGRMNIPAHIVHVYDALARLRGEAPDSFAARVEDNVRSIFPGLVEAP